MIDNDRFIWSNGKDYDYLRNYIWLRAHFLIQWRHLISSAFYDSMLLWLYVRRRLISCAFSDSLRLWLYVRRHLISSAFSDSVILWLLGALWLGIWLDGVSVRRGHFRPSQLSDTRRVRRLVELGFQLWRCVEASWVEFLAVRWIELSF